VFRCGWKEICFGNDIVRVDAPGTEDHEDHVSEDDPVIVSLAATGRLRRVWRQAWRQPEVRTGWKALGGGARRS